MTKPTLKQVWGFNLLAGAYVDGNVVIDNEALELSKF
jgi:hypothetical protein